MTSSDFPCPSRDCFQGFCFEVSAVCMYRSAAPHLRISAPLTPRSRTLSMIPNGSFFLSRFVLFKWCRWLSQWTIQEERTVVVYDKPWVKERTIRSDTKTQCTWYFDRVFTTPPAIPVYKRCASSPALFWGGSVRKSDPRFADVVGASTKESCALRVLSSSCSSFCSAVASFSQEGVQADVLWCYLVSGCQWWMYRFDDRNRILRFCSESLFLMSGSFECSFAFRQWICAPPHGAALMSLWAVLSLAGPG